MRPDWIWVFDVILGIMAMASLFMIVLAMLVLIVTMWRDK